MEFNLCPVAAMRPPGRNAEFINCLSQRGGAILSTGPNAGRSLGAPGLFVGGPVAYSFKKCTDGLSQTLLLG